MKYWDETCQWSFSACQRAYGQYIGLSSYAQLQQGHQLIAHSTWYQAWQGLLSDTYKNEIIYCRGFINRESDFLSFILTMPTFWRRIYRLNSILPAIPYELFIHIFTWTVYFNIELLSATCIFDIKTSIQLFIFYIYPLQTINPYLCCLISCNLVNQNCNKLK